MPNETETEMPHDTRAVSVRAGAKPLAIVPQTMEEAWRIAGAVVRAGMAPKGMNSAEACLVAIMHGLEIGLTPMSALQKIAVVNGRPTVWGDGAIGLVRASGQMAWIRETLEGEGDARVAVCEVQRKGDPDPVSRKFSVAQAKTAGIWNKDGPWRTYPERMLQMRARAFCLRDVFADVLGGLYIREEIEDDMRDVTPPRQETHDANVREEPKDPPARKGPPRNVQVIEHKPAETIEVKAGETVTIEQTATSDGEILEQTVTGNVFVGGEKVAEVEIKEPARKGPPRGVQAPAAPAADVNPEDLRKRLQDAIGFAEDPDTLQAAWEAIVEPHWQDLFPPDQEDLMGIFRQREREIAP